MPISTVAPARANVDVPLVGGTQIRLEGVEGTITHWTASGIPVSGPVRKFRGARTPAEDDTTFEFQSALDELNIIEQDTIHVDISPTYRYRSAATPVTGDRVVIKAATPPQAAAVQVVLYQDESGGITWHFADGASPQTAGATPAFRSSATGGATFTIPTRTASAQAALASEGTVRRFRGPITKLGRKIFKLLAIPLLEPIIGPVVKYFGETIEGRYRQELLREVTPENYQVRVSTPFKDWQRLEGKRSLLIIHGILSSTEGVLSRMPRSMMEELSAMYDGRVISFDQLTVSRSPLENANNLLNAIPTGRPYEFDILCHSRGGVVSRILAEGLIPSTNHLCRFPRVFFAASPNRGSVLADPEHIVDMIDVFTNFATSFPDGMATYSIEIVLGIVKLLATSMERRLPGLAAMGTKDYITQVLNRPTSATPQYAAAAAAYDPDPMAVNSFLTGKIGNLIIDRLFRDPAGAEVQNDLVVPFEGVYGENGSNLFPIVNPLIYGPNDHIWHNDFFRQSRTLEAIKQHFSSVDLRPGATSDNLSPLRPTRIWRGDYGESTSDSTSAERPEIDFKSMDDFSPDSVEGPAAPGSTQSLGMGTPMGGAPYPALGSSSTPVPRELRRTPEMDFHERVTAGREYDLPVRLDPERSGKPSISVQLQPDETETRVTVILRAPGFDIIGDDQQTMILKSIRNPDLEQVTFRVKPREPNPAGHECELSAEFWHQNQCVGAIRHVSFVTPSDGSAPGSAGTQRSYGFAIPNTPRTPCDISLIVDGIDEPEGTPFLMSLLSDLPGRVFRGKRLGKFSPDTQNQPLADYLTSIYRKQFARLPSTDAEFPTWEAQFNADLQGLGIQLWKALPEGFRNLYLELYSQGVEIRSILISSSEMVIPWELITPRTADGKLLPPLGQSHILGRWKPGLPMRPEPQRHRIVRFCVLNPQYPGPLALPASQEEVTELQRRFAGLNLVHPADFLTVQNEVINQTDVNIIHFSGHGTYDPANADLNELQLLNGRSLSALALAAGQFESASPFVYLNACHAGSTARVVGRMGGFVTNLLDSGCAGVVAPYWPVEDTRAKEFAVELYDKLLLQRSMGEALQELRQQNPEDLTYQSFAYFGDPWATMDFSGVM